MHGIHKKTEKQSNSFCKIVSETACLLILWIAVEVQSEVVLLFNWGAS